METDTKAVNDLLDIVNKGIEKHDQGNSPAFPKEVYLDLKSRLESLEPTASSFNSDLKHLKILVGELVAKAAKQTNQNVEHILIINPE